MGARYRSGRDPWPWITRVRRPRRGRWARTAAGVAVAAALLSAVWVLAGPVYAIGTGDSAQEVPYVVATVTCDGCSTGFVTSRGPGQPVPHTAEVATWAARDGWRGDGAYQTGWRCPRCLARYGETGGPRRYTIREVWFLHRRLRGGEVPAATP